MSDFNVPGTVGKLALPTFARFLDLRESELGFARYGSANRGRRSVFGPFEDSFPIGIPARPGKILAIREFHVVHECVFFPTCPGLRINLLRVRKTLRASAATSVGKFRNFQHSLISSACFHVRGRRSSRYRISTILVSSESLCYLFSKVPNRSSHHALQNGQGAVGSIQFSVWSTVWSNLGQPWSNLVKFGQNSPSSGKCILDHILRVSQHGGPYSDQERLGQTLVNTRSTLVKLGQPWSGFGKRAPDPVLRLFGVADLCQIRPAWFGLSRFACRHPRKSRGSSRFACQPFWGPNGRSRAWRRSDGMRKDDSWFESGRVARVWELARDHSRAARDGPARGPTIYCTARPFPFIPTLIDDPSSPTRPTGCDLAWGLPKSQIEWSNGLAFESKHVGDVNLRLQICSSLKLGGSTVWHLNPNTLRDDLAWGLPKSQIEWSNGLEPFESKHVGDVNLRLQICYPSLKLGEPTWVEACSFKNVTQVAVTRFVKNNIICRYGMPEMLITDNASNLNNRMMDQLCQQFKIQHHNSAPYRPKMNGAVEAANKNVKKILSKMTETYKDWHEHLPYAFVTTSRSGDPFFENPVTNSAGRSRMGPSHGMKQLNFIDEKRLAALCHGQLYQRRIERAYNKKARPRTFQARRSRSEEEEYGPIRSTRKVRTII
uniref:Integrase catalytic domain-containing protein n=1 Tax=Fagus sylvatica TaxID=28930 RepID=A0A2N9J9T4_FAGSY